MQRLRLKAPASVVADYFHLFVNRRAYTLPVQQDPTRKVPGITTTGPKTGRPTQG